MSDTLIVSIFFIGCTFPIIIFIVYFGRLNNKYKSLFERQRQKRGGQIKMRFGIAPQIEYPFQGRTIKVNISQGGQNSPPQTLMMLPLNGRQKLSVHVSPEFMLSSWAKKLGMQDIQLMNPEFDDAFIVKSDNETVIRQVLNHDVQKAMLALKDFYPSFHNYNKKYITFSVRQIIGEEARLDAFLNRGEVVLERFIALSL